MNKWSELTEALSQLPVFDSVNATKKQLDHIRPLPQEVEGRVMQKLRLEWNYHSNAIEGNKLTYGETYSFLMYGLTAKGKPFKDHLDIKGHNEAINFLTSLIKDERDLTEGDVRDLHKIILVEPYQSAAQTPDGKETTKTIRIGEYKQQPNHVKTLTGEIHYYATPEDVPIKMHELMQWYNEARHNKKIHPSVLAAFVHHRFVAIHPFDDGNGRLARILMNLILMKNGYPPAIIKLKERTDYYAALNQADKNEYVPIIEFVAEAVSESMNLYLKAARGESIEDSSDLDKKIALLNTKLKKEHIKKDDKLLKKVLITTCKNLTDGFTKTLEDLFQKLNGLSFSEKQVKPFFFTDAMGEGDRVGGVNAHPFSYRNVEESIINHEKSQKLPFIRFDFIWKNLKLDSGEGIRIFDFKVYAFLDFNNDFKYKVWFKDSLNSDKKIIILERNYDDDVSEQEIKEVIERFKEYTFESLEKKIEEANKG